jgi:hypothetical protein
MKLRKRDWRRQKIESTPEVSIRREGDPLVGDCGIEKCVGYRQVKGLQLRRGLVKCLACCEAEARWNHRDRTWSAK